MRVTQVQRKLLDAVVQRFLDTKEPVTRISLVKRVMDPEIVDALIPVILRNPNGEKLFPTTLAFECCGNLKSLQLAKRSVETLISALKELFNSDPEAVEFLVTDIEKHIQKASPGTSRDHILLGLYLAQELDGILAGLAGLWPNYVSAKIHEGIGLQNPANAWAKHIAQYRLFLGRRANRDKKLARNSDPKSLNSPPKSESQQWDFFISHASEDKEEIARPLADGLTARGAIVWYDEFALTAGDSLREKIDFGLSRSRFGIVILSHHFFNKDWPKKELNGLVSREVHGKKVILPVWHGLDARELRRYSPILADKVALKTDQPTEQLVDKLLTAAGMLTRDRLQLRSSGPKDRKQEAKADLDFWDAAASPLALQTTLAERPKRGRRTIPDNHLLGARNSWASLLEQNWHDIGWNLICIRQQRNGSFEGLRSIFDKLKSARHNAGLAEPLHRALVEAASPSEVTRNQKVLGELDAEILRTQMYSTDCERFCWEADAALKAAGEANEKIIREEVAERKERFEQAKRKLRELQAKREMLGAQVRDQEAFVYRSELLDFLNSGRASVKPRELANALAGLPRMKWQQSNSRCADMPFNAPMAEYNILEAISRIWSRVSRRLKEPPVEFFKGALLKRFRKEITGFQFLRDNWFDLEHAIREIWKPEQLPGSFPFLLTTVLLEKAMRPKTAADRILADRAKLAIAPDRSS